MQDHDGNLIIQNKNTIYICIFIGYWLHIGKDVRLGRWAGKGTKLAITYASMQWLRSDTIHDIQSITFLLHIFQFLSSFNFRSTYLFTILVLDKIFTTNIICKLICHPNHSKQIWCHNWIKVSGYFIVSKSLSTLWRIYREK